MTTVSSFQQPADAASSRPCVFVCRDPLIGPFLDRIAKHLEAGGSRVVRGPEVPPGTILDYRRDQYDELFGVADIAMFSSRSRCTRSVMEAAPRLHAIINPSIGVETIDLAAANELGIIVGNGATPENYIAMAEASVMLMLNLMYGLRTSEAILSQGRPKPAPDQLHARMMWGATIGIVGLGNIGRAVMDRLLPFDAKLLVYSPRADVAGLPRGVESVGLDMLLERSDIVGLFAASGPDKRGLIGRAQLARMKRTAYLVNVARGELVDEPALIEALQEKRLAGAALDTFAAEPLPMDSPLRALPNVILTPHLVGQTREGYLSLELAAMENLSNVLAGQLPRFCKNPETEPRWHERLRAIGYSNDAPERRHTGALTP